MASLRAFEMAFTLLVLTLAIYLTFDRVGGSFF